MKKTLLILFALLLCASYADARGFVACAGGGDQCSTVAQFVADNGNTTSVARYANQIGRATRFTVAEDYTTCKVRASFIAVGTPTGTIQICFYNDSTEALVGSCSSAVGVDVVSAADYYDFPMSVTLPAGTYRIGFIRSTANENNYIQIKSNNTFCNACTISYDGASWSGTLNVRFAYEIYK